MAQYTEGCVKAFPVAGALGQHLRVVYSSGVLSLAGADSAGIGTMENPIFTSAESGACRLWACEGTRKMVASAAITDGALVYAAAGGKIAPTGSVCLGQALQAASGDGSIIEVHAIAPATGVIRQLRRRATIAEVNAGITLLAAIAGFKYRMIDAAAIAVGGAAGAVTTVDILATQTTSVKLVAFGQANLTQSTLVRAGASGGTILADGASFVQNDVNTAITLGKTGSSVTTATHIDILLTYVVES